MINDSFDCPEDGSGESPVPAVDPLRPSPVRGRYILPDPQTGKKTGWQRVTNFIKLAEDTYHLELWKQRNLAKGLSLRPEYVEEIRSLAVKADKNRLNQICERAQEAAGAYLMAEEGNELHKSTEITDLSNGSLAGVPVRHQARMLEYRRTLRAAGVTVEPGMVERVMVNTEYEVAGKFDRVFRLEDGSCVIGDVKTGDSLDLSMHSISAQLACYQGGINDWGVWDGVAYDQSIRVRRDFGLVVHMPSTRPEITLYQVCLSRGRELNQVCREVRSSRRVKPKDVAQVFQAQPVSEDWTERLNAAVSLQELIAVRHEADRCGQWTGRLADLARLLAAGFPST